MAKSFFSLVTELETLLGQLNIILAGTDGETVTVNGVEKDSISKAIKEHFSYIETIVQGRIAYKTKANMLADLDHDEDTLAEVVADGEKNGLYYKTGISGEGTWQKSDLDRIDSIRNKLVSTSQSLLNIMADRLDDKLSDNTTIPSIAWGLVDKSGKMALAVNKRGNLVTSSSEEVSVNLARTTINSSSNIVWGIVDLLDHLVLGITERGELKKPGETSGLLSENTHNLAFGLTDSKGNLAFGIDNQGRAVIPSLISNNDLPSLIIENDDVFSVAGNSKKKLTTAGRNLSARYSGDKIIFVSDRCRGRFAEYEMDINGNNQKRYHSVNRQIEQVVINGQSLAQGGANDAITLSAPYPSQAFKFENGPVGSNDENIFPTITELKESENETISTAFAAKLISGGFENKLLLSGQAYGGADYDHVKKGGIYDVYNKTIEQVKFASRYPNGSVVKAVFFIHGEADGVKSNNHYDSDLADLISDYDNDIKVSNGQTDDVLLFICQTSSASGYTTIINRDSFTTPFAQLKANDENDNIFLVCPKYFLDYVDHSHIDAASTQLLGEYYAKAYETVIVEGNDYHPVKPINFLVNNNTITIDFLVVSNTELKFDIENVMNPGDFGFNYFDDDNNNIVSVEIISSSQVKITLDNPPASNARISYAFHNGTDGMSGRQNGARGNLRDSDNTKSHYQPTVNLYNWAVSFEHYIN